LKLAFENGDSVRLAGAVADAVKLTGLDLDLTGALPRPAAKEGTILPSPGFQVGLSARSTMFCSATCMLQQAR
jgi:hypothetical protein